MNPRPIAFRNPELAAMHEGRLRHFRRLADGSLKGIGPGDRLWIREPFFLAKRFESASPTNAMHLGAEPFFLADVGFRHRIPWLGRIRAARELCRPWHRRHLVIGSVRHEDLQAISEADLADGGYRDIEHFAQLWDRDCLAGRKAFWHNNPRVLRCTFSLLPCQVPEPAPKPKVAKPRRKPGPTPGKAAAERAKRLAARAELDRPAPGPVERLQRPRAETPGRTWCDQCERRVSPEEGRACSAPFCGLAMPKLEDAA